MLYVKQNSRNRRARGAALVEYSLLVVLIAVGVISSAKAAGYSLSCAFAKATYAIVNKAAPPPTPWSGYGAVNCNPAGSGSGG